ncbi:Asparaginase [Sergentomyia squamirostris]
MENSSDCEDIGLELRGKINESASVNHMSIGSSARSVNLNKMGSVTSPKLSDKSSLRRNRSYGNMLASGHSEAKVLVIYTGGTIGMVRNEKNALEPIPNALVKNIRRFPHMHDVDYAQQRFGSGASMGPLVLPYVENQHRRVVYTVTEYDPLLDSSNMTINDWVRLAEDIKQSYEFFDGFVILHGTDTLSYTASALSFMLENLGKTIVITGSQIPIFETRTDGKDNFTSALIIAGNYVIPEVTVFFGSKLYRGNRTIKISSAALDAFDSPNVTCLAKTGINVEVDYRMIFRPCGVSRFDVHSTLDENVGILRIFPSITTATIRAFLQPPMRGVVLQSFGAGNIPSNRQDMLQALKDASDNGMIIINCTQCTTGSVADLYEPGRLLQECGVISGYDMTPEAALTKLAYCLGKSEWSLEEKKKMMQRNLRGELTAGKSPDLQEYDLVDAVARSLHLSSPQELSQLGATLFPAMVNTAVKAGDMTKVELMKSYGADLSSVNYDHRTALHVAAAEGREDMVKHLLLHGVTVHVRDRHDRTPLMEAIANDYHEIIRLLIKCGAHITGSARGVGEFLCAAAARGLQKRLESYRLAGADLSQPDTSGRTPLHVAALHGHKELVQYLLKNYVDKDEVDLLGLTAQDYARRGGHEDICMILQKNHVNGSNH